MQFAVFFFFLALLSTSHGINEEGYGVVDGNLSKGRRLTQNAVDEIGVSATATLQEAFRNLRRGQTVVLRSRSYAFERKLIIDVRDVTLVGDTSGRTTISCPQDDSAVLIRSSNVTISDITFQDCRDVSAVVVENNPNNASRTTRAVFERVSFQNNTQEITGQTGVTVFAQIVGTLTIQPCSAEPCEGPMPEVEVRHSTFEENEADQGGGIHCARCKLRIVNSTFRGNRAQSDGGAIFARDPGTEVDIVDSIFINNLVTRQRIDFEVTRQDGRPIELVRHFIFNSPGNGGGALSTNSITNLSVAGSSFLGNRALSGGAMRTILDGRILRTSANLSHVLVTNSTFEENEATIPDASPREYNENNIGGAVYFACSTENLGDWRFDNCTFRNNTARHGGALHVVTLRQNGLTMDECLFENNQAEEAGGAVLLRNTGGFEANASTWHRNRANLGGGILLTNAANFRSRGLAGFVSDGRVGRSNVFSENSAVYGGGIMCAGCGEVTLQDTNITNNDARDSGGGLYVLDAPDMISIHQSIFDSNVAYQGGGIALRSAASVGFRVVESSFSNVLVNNTAVVGGGLFAEANRQQQNSLAIRQTRFERNRAVPVDDPGFPFVRGRSDAEEERSGRSLLQQTERSDSPSTDDRSPACGEGGGGGMCLVYSVLPESSIGDVILTEVVFDGNVASIGGGASVQVAGDGWNRDHLRGCPEIRPTTEPCRLFRLVNVNATGNVAEYGAGGWFVSRPESILVGCDSLDPEGWVDVLSATNSNQLSTDYCLRFENNTVMDSDGEYGKDIATGVYALKLLSPTSPIVNHTGGEVLIPSCQDPEGCSKNASDGIKVAVKDAFNQTITGGIADAELQVLLVSTAILGEQDYLATKGIFNVNNTLGIGIGNTSEITFRSGQLKTNLTFSTRKCFPGEIEAGNICQPCPMDQYSFNTSGTCSDCEDHAKCNGRSTLVPIDGYWHSTPFSPQFHECIIKEACKYTNRETVLRIYYEDGDKISDEIAALDVYISNEQGITRPSYDDYEQCSTGYRGILCGSCKAGYGHSAGGECIKCLKRRGVSIIITIGSTVITFLMLAIEVYLTLKSISERELPAGQVFHQDGVADRILEVLINYMQTTSLVLNVNVEWPDIFQIFLKVQDFSATPTGGTFFVPLECTFEENAQGEDGPNKVKALFLRIGLPVSFGLLIIAACLLLWICRRQQGSLSVVALFVTFAFSYGGLSSELFKAVNCIRVDRKQSDPPNEYDLYALEKASVWAEDPTIHCSDEEYKPVKVVGIIGLIILHLPFVFFLFGIAIHLIKNCNTDSENDDISRTTKRVYVAFLSWELLIALRKELVAAAVVFAARRGPNLQATLSSGILIIALTVHWFFGPFIMHILASPSHSNNQNWWYSIATWSRKCEAWHTLETVSLLASISVFYSAILFGDPETSDRLETILAVIVLIVNVLFIFFIVFIYTVHKICKWFLTPA